MAGVGRKLITTQIGLAMKGDLFSFDLVALSDHVHKVKRAEGR